eukprot:6463587-Prymnesium_polylepis.1
MAASATSADARASTSLPAFSTSAGPALSGPSFAEIAPGGQTPEQPTPRAVPNALQAASSRAAPLRWQRLPVQTVMRAGAPRGAAAAAAAAASHSIYSCIC